MAGQTFSAGSRPTGAQLTNIVYQNEDGISNAAVTAGTDTTASASYVNLAGTGSVSSFNFTKVLTATRIKVEIALGWQCITATANIQGGVLVNGTDYDCVKGGAQISQNVISPGFVIISGLAAGSYTVQGRWKRILGTGTPTRSVNEWLTISAAEIT